jgi:phytoene/squalene synthetase
MWRVLRPAASIPEPLIRYAVQRVKDHDAAALLPGYLLRSLPYFAIRSFFVETGLRLAGTAAVPPNSTPAEHLAWWQEGIDRVFDDTLIDVGGAFARHPTLHLLHLLKTEHDLPWTKSLFDNVIAGRINDLDVAQYETMDDLITQAGLSCASLTRLVLESHGFPSSSSSLSHAHQAAALVGVTHGLTQQLRHSIPVLSVTGRLIVPAELTRKYGVKSPRYLLSALAMGDAACQSAFQQAIREIHDVAVDHLARARALPHTNISTTTKDNQNASAILLSATIPSETFLERLRAHDYQLTSRTLRQVGLAERGLCAWRVVAAYAQSKY